MPMHLPTLVSGLLLALPLSTQAATPVPPQVRAATAQMKADCLTFGGKPAPSPDLVLAVDLNGDGRLDYVINTAGFNCRGAESAFAGAGGGGQVQVFLTGPQGDAIKAFEQGADDVHIVRGELWLAVGGELCGQTPPKDAPRSDLQACWRPLQWDARARKLDFAPLSRIQPHRP